jgi:hypothetical protein
MNQFSPSTSTVVCPSSLRTPSLAKPGIDSIASLEWTVLPASRHELDEYTRTPILPGQVVETELAGTSYYACPAALPLIWEGQEIWLVRKPENYHDANAIAAHRRAGRLLGYIPRGLAGELAPIFDGYGLPVPAIVTALINGSRPFTVHIRFIVPQPDLPDDPPPQPHVPPGEDKQLSPPRDVVTQVGCGSSDPPAPAPNLSSPEPPAPPPAETALDSIQAEPAWEPTDTILETSDPPTDSPSPEEVVLALPSRNGNVTEVMGLAASELRWLWIEYSDGWGNVTQRNVLPLSPYTACDGAPGYQCWCALRRDFRTFLCNRILAVVPGERLSQRDGNYQYLARLLPDVLPRACHAG